MRTRLVLLLVLAVASLSAASSVNWRRLGEPWPELATGSGIPGVEVSWPSHSPFAPDDIGGGPRDDPATMAQGRLYLPSGAHPPHSVPAVVLLHGSGGVLPTRELTYAPQLAQLGVAALVVDSVAARRDRGTGLIERVLNITETMMLADAYSALGFLAARPEIDPHRIVLTGFSYGAMATMYALYAQLADKLAPAGLRFAGHVAFYGPCIARFADTRTTGAPLLMLIGGGDEIVDQRRCARSRSRSARWRQPGRDGRLSRRDPPMGRRLRAPPDRPQPRRLCAVGRARRNDPRPAHWSRDDGAVLAQADPRAVHAFCRPLPDRTRRPGAGAGGGRLGPLSRGGVRRAGPLITAFGVQSRRNRSA